MCTADDARRNVSSPNDWLTDWLTGNARNVEQRWSRWAKAYISQIRVLIRNRCAGPDSLCESGRSSLRSWKCELMPVLFAFAFIELWVLYVPYALRFVEYMNIVVSKRDIGIFPSYWVGWVEWHDLGAQSNRLREWCCRLWIEWCSQSRKFYVQSLLSHFVCIYVANNPFITFFSCRVSSDCIAYASWAYVTMRSPNYRRTFKTLRIWSNWMCPGMVSAEWIPLVLWDMFYVWRTTTIFNNMRSTLKPRFADDDADGKS